jgi:CheY-like chemotaxis protein
MDKKALDRHRKELLRRAEAIQRQLDEVTRAARDELVSIRDQIRALDSTGITSEEHSERRASFLDHKSVVVKKKGKTVLIVEKQRNYSQSLGRQTLFAGHKPVVATTAEGGLRKAKKCHPDLILLEIDLPDMDGLKFITEIRRNPEADRIPIIALSAFPHLRARCLELGCDDFLLKPVRMIDLITCTRKFFHSGPKASVPLTW